MKKNFRPSIAVSITDNEVSLLKEDIVALVDYLELRVDLCSVTNVEYLGELLRSLNGLGKEIILTVRDPKEGGGRAFSQEDRITLYEELSHYAQILDTEVSSGLIGILKERMPEKTILGSFHDFNATPPLKSLEDIYARARSQGADLVKIATMVDSLEDVKVLGRFCISRPGDVVVVGMGRWATLSRVFFPFIGSCFTYASLGEPKAPGQVHISRLRTLIDEIMR